MSECFSDKILKTLTLTNCLINTERNPDNYETDPHPAFHRNFYPVIRPN